MHAVKTHYMVLFLKKCSAYHMHETLVDLDTLTWGNSVCNRGFGWGGGGGGVSWSFTIFLTHTDGISWYNVYNMSSL